MMRIAIIGRLEGEDVPVPPRFDADLVIRSTTADRKEGMTAFLEQRPPHFTGE
jgi:hypothetical protein